MSSRNALGPPLGLDGLRYRRPPQDYSPIRNTILDHEQLREFQRLNHWRPVFDTLLIWGQIVLVWWLVSKYFGVIGYILAIPVIGTRFYALYIIGHDGLHRRLFASVWANDLWNDVFILGPIGAITRLNRANHMNHHRSLATPADPDRYKYLLGGRAGPIRFLLCLFGLPFVARAVVNVFSRRNGSAKDSFEDRYAPRDFLIVVSWQLGLLFVLSMGIGWWAYFVLWWLPVYVFTFCADLTRVMAEHASFEAESDADRTLRLVSFRSSWVERQFFAPMGMNHHATHHLWPGIPYYNLAAAEAVVRKHPLADQIVWRGSYSKFVFRAFTWAITGRKNSQ